MNTVFRTSITFALAALAACSLAQKATRTKGVDLPGVKFNLIQLNDIYEITPIRGEGGMAKTATLYNSLKLQNPNTFVVVAGDFFSPSALGTAKVDGERLAGKQMVMIMNAVPVKLVTFGNHEFDVNEKQFGMRMAESKFDWVSSNVWNKQKTSFPNVPENRIEVYKNGSAEVRVGYFGVTLPANKASFVEYSDYMEAAAKQVKELRSKVDVLIAITHLAYEDDIKLAARFPEIDLIIGGHEHVRHQIEIGSLPGIYKADANARSAFVHEFAFDPLTRRLSHKATLRQLDASVPEDPTVKAEVDKWVEIAFAGFRKDGFNPETLVATVPEDLDGKEDTVRFTSSNLSKIIADGMISAAPGVDLAIYNGGSIRIDDVIPAGPMTEYDVIRVLPFGGKIVQIEMKGSLLAKALDQGVANRGNGGYLQTANVSGEVGKWSVKGAVLDPNKTYKVAISDFLLTGLEQNLGFLKKDNPDIKVIAELVDIRNSTIAQLKKLFK